MGKVEVKDNHPIDKKADKITLKHDTTKFQTGIVTTSPATSYKLELKNIMGKVNIKDDTPIQKLNDRLYFNYDIVDFKTSTQASGYQLELNSISTSKINLNANDVLKNSDNKLVLNYDTSTLTKDTTTNELVIKIKPSGGISKDTTGIYQTYEIAGIDSQTLEKSATNVLSVKLKDNDGLKTESTGLQLKIPPLNSCLYIDGSGIRVKTKTSGGISISNDGLYQSYQIDGIDLDTLEKSTTAAYTNRLSVKLQSSSSGLEVGSNGGLKIKLPELTSGLDLTTSGLKINLPVTSSGLELTTSGLKINLPLTTSGLELQQV
jgi:hypothetical protein